MTIVETPFVSDLPVSLLWIFFISVVLQSNIEDEAMFGWDWVLFSSRFVCVCVCVCVCVPMGVCSVFAVFSSLISLRFFWI